MRQRLFIGIPNVPTGFGDTDEICSSGNSGKRAVANAAILAANPLLNTTSLSFEKPAPFNLILVFDITGRLVHTYSGNEVADDAAHLPNESTIPVGTYFIKYKDFQGEHYQKHMVLKR